MPEPGEKFSLPATTDGSYIGRMKQKEAREKILSSQFHEELEGLKSRLKQSKTKVGIKVSGGTIQLQATLPPKSGKGKNKQQLISLNIPANLNGLKTAEEEAYELGKLIARKQFEWNDKYLGRKAVKQEIKTIGELLKPFEKEYFKTRPQTLKSQNTFNNYKIYLRSYIGLETLTTEQDLQNAVDQLPDWSIKICISAINVLAETLMLGFRVKLNRKIEKNKQARNIPDDRLIEKSYKLFDEYALKKRNHNLGCWNKDSNWLLYQWCYGMLAVFGLRPRELFVNPDIDWWLSQENLDLTWKVHKDCKTGERQALPLHKQWIEEFDLRNPKYLEMLKEVTSQELNFKQITNLTRSVSRWFRQVEIDFTPYDLRHAWAIRAHLLGIPIKAAADNLGHTVQIHTETYQRWFSLDNRKRAINEALNKKNEVEMLRDEVQRLKLENEKLKIELERYRLGNNIEHFASK